MTGASVVILLGVLGTIALVAIASSWLDAASRSWRTLAGRYPPQPHDIGAEEGTGVVFLFTEQQAARAARPIGCLWFLIWPVGLYLWYLRSGIGRYTVRWATDATHLHLDLDSGRTGASRAMSIPLLSLRTISSGPTHFGAFTWFALDEFVLALPDVMIEDELATRRALGEPGGEVS